MSTFSVIRSPTTTNGKLSVTRSRIATSSKSAGSGTWPVISSSLPNHTPLAPILTVTSVTVTCMMSSISCTTIRQKTQTQTSLVLCMLDKLIRLRCLRKWTPRKRVRGSAGSSSTTTFIHRNLTPNLSRCSILGKGTRATRASELEMRRFGSQQTWTYME